MPKLTRRVARAVGLVAVAALVIFLLTPTGCYLSRAGWEEAKILAQRKRITKLVEDERTDSLTRAKLRLVLAARSFAADSVQLRAGESFTAYTHLRRDTLVLVLSGAFRDRLVPYTWWFPVVGRVPYKGYFDFDAARAAQRDLERRGFDTYLRPASAFSTLGWFNDPLLSTTLRQDSLDLANTVIHELTHNTFYAPGQAVFNESFANFVGSRGAAWFYRARGHPAAATEVDAQWADDKVLASFWHQLYKTLDSAFAAHPDDRDARLAARDSIYARSRRTLTDSVAPRLTTLTPAQVARFRLDNAALLARRVYATDLEIFDAVYAREGHDLRRAIARIIALAKDQKDPFAALNRWAAAADGQRRDQ